MAYQDDFSGAETPEKAVQADMSLGNLLTNSGLVEKQAKHISPVSVMSNLGIQFNTNTMTMEIPPDKLKAINHDLDSWLSKTIMSRKELESLIGKLAFLAKCVHPGHIFI